MTSPEPVNALTIDVEDYFQVSAFEKHIDRDQWDSLPHRVESNTDRILELLDEKDIKATFFVLGWVAERYPDLIRRISDQGHELASHGFAHVRVTAQDREQFRADVSDTRKLLEDTASTEVIGFRAASFSIGQDNMWALDVLNEVGYRYSSSVYPVHHDLYGMPDAPRFPFKWAESSVLEVPISTVRLGSRNYPCGGGGYFRLLPYAVSRWLIARVNKTDGRSAIFYFHPWELDPEQPRQNGLPLKSRFRHYINLGRTENRLRHLLDDFKWGRMDEIFLDSGHGSEPTAGSS